MTILAFGCSVTHGTDIVDSGNSVKNIPYSYPAVLAKYLGVKCFNRAFCGNSNENIFHQALESIPKHQDITAIVVGWTSVEREVWRSAGRTWQFIPSWCGTSANVWEPFTHHISPPARGSLHDVIPYRCADSEEYITVLDSFYELLTKYKFDPVAYTKKRDNYISALRAYCNTNNIKLIETCWSGAIDGAVNIGLIGTWHHDLKRHPSVEEHDLFAKEIITHYKL